MASLFRYELGDDIVPGFHIIADQGGDCASRQLKVGAPDNSYKLWNKIDLTAAECALDNRLLQLVSSLDHPHLSRITGLYKINDGRGLIIQTEFPVMTLKDRLQECIRPLLARGVPVRGLGIPVDELLRYMEQIAEALDFLNMPQHDCNGEKIAVLPPALRPECLHLFDTPAGRVCRIADFGLFGLVSAAKGGDVTKHLQAFAPPEFTPPEVANGKISRMSNQFSLAAVYYYLRANEMPYTGTLLQQMQAQMTDSPDLSLVPQAEALVIRRALMHDPNRRHPRCKAFVQELLAVVPRSGVIASISAAPAAGSAGGNAARTGSGAEAPTGRPAAADPNQRTSAIFYRRGTGLSQMEIEVPPAPATNPAPPVSRPEAAVTKLMEPARGGRANPSAGKPQSKPFIVLPKRPANEPANDSEGERADVPQRPSALDVAAAEAASGADSDAAERALPSELAAAGEGAALGQAREDGASGEAPAAGAAGEQHAAAMEPPNSVKDANKSEAAGAPVSASAGRASVPPVRTGEKPKVYMPRSRPEVVLPSSPSPRSEPAATRPVSNPSVDNLGTSGSATALGDSSDRNGGPVPSRDTTLPSLASPSVPTPPWLSHQKTPIMPRRPSPGGTAPPLASFAGPTEAPAPAGPPWAVAQPVPYAQTPVPPWTDAVRAKSASITLPTSGNGSAALAHPSTTWSWIQLVILLALAAFLGYAMLL